MIELGKQYGAEMLREEAGGIWVKIKGEEAELLAKASFDFSFEKGKEVTVFVGQQDKQGFTATFRSPQLLLNEVDFLQVVSLTDVGMFLDWGLEKDLFCPFALIVDSPKPGMYVPVRLIKDQVSHRLMATMKWKAGVLPAGPEFYRSMEVEILVMEPVSLGFSVLVNHQYLGILYENQVFKALKTGQRMVAYVNKVRQDGKLDLLLQRPGYGEVIDAEERLMEAILEGGGKLKLGDKSTPEEIYAQLQMSKKVFKKALGGLLKARRIDMNETSVWMAIRDEE